MMKTESFKKNDTKHKGSFSLFAHLWLALAEHIVVGAVSDGEHMRRLPPRALLVTLHLPLKKSSYKEAFASRGYQQRGFLLLTTIDDFTTAPGEESQPHLPKFCLGL